MRRIPLGVVRKPMRLELRLIVRRHGEMELQPVLKVTIVQCIGPSGRRHVGSDVVIH